MNVPVPLRLAAITLAATAFYTWVGQMVPQKEVHPPQVVEIKKDVTTAELVEIGKTIFEGKGICNTCHKIGGSGVQRFPDLDGVAVRAATRIPGMSALDYLAHSLYEPNSFIVPGFNPGMPQIDKPPIGLTDPEILAVIAFLQTLGGEATVTMETNLRGGAGHANAPAEAGGAVPSTPAPAVPTAAETTP